VQVRRRLKGPAVVAIMALGCAVILGSIVGGIALSVVGNGRAPGAGGLPASVSNTGDSTPPAVSTGPTRSVAPSSTGPTQSSGPVHVVASTASSRTASPRPRVSISPTPRLSQTCEPIGPTPSPGATGPTPLPCDT
jgi:hypothetical protein